LVFISNAGQFCECSDLKRNAVKRKFSEMSKSWPVVRLLLVFGDRQRLAPCFLSGVRPKFLTVSPVCGRRNETIATA
jgi:hypothetical protein